MSASVSQLVSRRVAPLLASLALFATAFAAEPEDYAGRFEQVDPEGKAAALESAVEQGADQFAALLRPLARSRLRKVVQAPDYFEFTPGPGTMGISSVPGRLWTTPLDGSWQTFKLDGGQIQLRRWMKDGHLHAEATSGEGGSVFTWKLAADGGSITLDVVTSSARLEQPLRYAIVYQKR